MSKYCMQCGKQIESNANHCQFCGSSQDMGFDAATLNKLNKTSEQKKNNNLLVPIVAAVSVILVVIIVFLNLTVFNDSYEKPIENFLKAIEKGDGDYLMDIVPDYLDVDEDEMNSLAKDAHSLFKMGFGNDFDLDYDIIDKEEISDKKLSELEKSIKKDFDKKVDVDKGFTVDFEMTIDGDDKNETSETSINVYKIDGEWCLTENFSDYFGF